VEEKRCDGPSRMRLRLAGTRVAWPGGEPTEEQHDTLMEQWYHEHADPIRQELQLLSPIVEARAAHIET
jgi:hypothetical protein